MAYDLIFKSTKESGLGSKLELFINDKNELTLMIESNSIQYICLDRATAIKLGREVRKQVSFMEV